MLRGIGDALVDPVGNLVDRTLTLREQIDYFRATAISQRLRNGGERVEQRRLRRTT